MLASNIQTQTKIVWPTIPLSILIGTLYGATWALLVLLLPAYGGVDSGSPAWIEAAVARATIGLWFGAIGGGLAGLIYGATCCGIDIDSEPWSNMLKLVGVGVISVAAIIMLYTAVLNHLVIWLATTNWSVAQGDAATIVILGLVLLLPAFGAVRLLKPQMSY